MQLLAHYWMQMVATLLAVAAVGKCWLDHAWRDHYFELAVLFFGWISVIAADEVADWTGNYGWTRSQWRRRPEWFIRGAGLIAVAIVAARLYW